jgi:hypothetical protein
LETSSKATKPKKRGVLKLLILGAPFFVAGCIIATGFHGTGPLVAKGFGTENHVATELPATMQSYFAEFADKLSPTVVNVKITKGNKANFSGHQLPERFLSGALLAISDSFLNRCPDIRHPKGLYHGSLSVATAIFSPTITYWRGPKKSL